MCDDAQERKGKKKKESRFEDVSQSHHVRDILHKYYWNSQKTMYRRTRDIRVTTISTYVDIYFLSLPGLTGYNQGKPSSLYRPPGSCTHPHTVCGYTI